VLTIFGLVMVFSASSVIAAARHGNASHYFIRQLLFGLAGYLLMLVLMNVDYHAWQNQKVLVAALLLSAAALVAVLFQPAINGAHRWIRIGSLFSLQPSEFAKLSVLVFLASYLHEHEAEMRVVGRPLLVSLAIPLLFCGAILVEPDLGQALCISLIVATVLFLAGLSWKFLLALGLAALPLLYLAIVRVPYRWERMKTFLNPLHDPLGAGWQISQSLTAVGSGGITGLGFGASRQKLFFLPEAHSDFIFAVVGEELGLLGTCAIALGFLVFFFRGMRVALMARDRFGYYLGIGMTLLVVLPALLNMSMVLAMMPTKGIALPFISQGGSSLLASLMASGILLNISQQGGQE
jgi:cell division protein FtsW